jgi:hypothetical protein
MLAEPEDHAAERFRFTFLRGSAAGRRVSPTPSGASLINARETVEDLTAALIESGAVAASLEAAVNAS